VRSIERRTLVFVMSAKAQVQAKARSTNPTKNLMCEGEGWESHCRDGDEDACVGQVKPRHITRNQEFISEPVPVPIVIFSS
jgi:hypothetical protein